MPHIVVQLPQGAYPQDHRRELVRLINDAAVSAEGLAGSARSRSMCWVLLHEIPIGVLTMGGQEVPAGIVPCVIEVSVPSGVLQPARRAEYVRLLHEALERAHPNASACRIISSVRLHDVEEGHWGVNGEIWHLADFTKAAGYAHLA